MAFGLWQNDGHPVSDEMTVKTSRLLTVMTRPTSPTPKTLFVTRKNE